MKRILFTPAAVICATAIALYARPDASYADMLSLVVTVGATLACVYLIRKYDPNTHQLQAWMQRASYQEIVRDVGAEYAYARSLHYTARDSRSHIRAYLNVRYKGLNNAERSQVMRDAIEYGNQFARPDIDTANRAR